LFHGHFQPLTSPQALNALVIDQPTGVLKQSRNSTIPVPAILPSQCDRISEQAVFIRPAPWGAPLGGSMLAQYPANPAFGHCKLAADTRPHDVKRPLVCLDETSKQLTPETCAPIPMAPGRPARQDYEYKRNGTASLFMLFAPLEGWCHVSAHAHRAAIDYAHVLKKLSDVHFPKAESILLVQDNLNTHTAASLYRAFPPAEARRIADRFEWHYTPKHGSWLNMAEADRCAHTFLSAIQIAATTLFWINQ
jgi:hypothetical protein